MDKHTILQSLTKAYQSVMDYFNKHEGQMDEMLCELEKEQTAKEFVRSTPETQEATPPQEVTDAKN